MSVEFDGEALYVALDKARRSRRLQWRDIGREASVSSSTFTRLGQGRHVSAQNLTRILLWLGTTDLAPYIVTKESQ